MTTAHAPIRLLAAFALLAFATGVAQADDSVAVLDAGGVTVGKTNDIALIEQSLFLSPKAVRVRSVFRNVSRSPIDTAVAFVLPDVDYHDWAQREQSPPPAADPGNFLHFKARVDGQRVAVRPIFRAMLNGHDVTDKLKAAGLPVSFFDPGFRAVYDALPKAKRDALIKDGLISPEQPARPDEPTWSLRSRFVWDQHFPVGDKVVVEHDYRPGLGTLPVYDAHSAATYCHAPSPKGRRPWILHYSLTTGGNWAGGKIGTLHVRIETEAPYQTIATCFPGLARAGSRVYVGSYHDFRPNQDIRLLFISDEAAASADCAGVRDKATAYKKCLEFVSVILTLNLRQALQDALEKYSAIDDKERASGKGKADRVQMLDHAQKAWEAYLEAECEAAPSLVAPAKDAATAKIRCRNTLVRQRLNAIGHGH